MKIGTKIISGFAIAIMLTVIIGGVSIYNLGKVGKIVRQLATQEIPETSAVIKTERETWNTHVLSYGFNAKVDEQSKKEWFDQRDHITEAADEIIPIATALNHQDTLKAANDIKQHMVTYNRISEEYVSLALKNKAEEAQMKKNVLEVKNLLVEYLDGQNRDIEKAVEVQDWQEVVKKITRLNLGNNLMGICNNVIGHQYEYLAHQHQENAIALRNNANKLDSLLKDVLKITRKAANVKTIEATLKNITKYRNAAEGWVVNRAKQADILKQADAMANEIIDVTTKTAMQADKDAYDIGMETVKLADSVKMVLIVLLIATILLGSVLAFFITRGITKPINRIIEGLNEGAGQVASASGQVSSASQSLAEGSSEQAASIEETSASLEEMSSMTKQNADNAGQADSLMKETSHVVSDAESSMIELTTSMKDISSASDETQKDVKT